MSRQHTVFLVTLSFSITTGPVFAQDQPVLRQAPIITHPFRAPVVEPALPQALADWSRTRARGPAVDEATLRAEAETQAAGQAPALNLANLPIEDAVTLMMLLIAEDARDDLRDMLGDMDETRRQREAMRRQQAIGAQGTASRRVAPSDLEEGIRQGDDRERRENRGPLRPIPLTERLPQDAASLDGQILDREMQEAAEKVEAQMAAAVTQLVTSSVSAAGQVAVAGDRTAQDEPEGDARLSEGQRVAPHHNVAGMLEGLEAARRRRDAVAAGSAATSRGRADPASPTPSLLEPGPDARSGNTDKVDEPDA